MKKYEQDCVKGIRTFCWPSYTCTPSRNGLAVTSYLPIDNYVCQDLKSFPSYQKNPNVKPETMAFYGTHTSSIMFYANEYGLFSMFDLQQSTFSYNSYACSNHPSSNPYYEMTHFPGTDKELFPGNTSMSTMSFKDNNMEFFGFDNVEKFGLMTLYGEDYSTGNYKSKNYRYGFVFNLYPKVNFDYNYTDVFSNFKYNDFDINRGDYHYPYKKVIYRIDIKNDMVRYYYGEYRPANRGNPYNDSMSGFINEISGVSNLPYFTKYRNKLFPGKPVNDLNKDYHHFAITGFSNHYGNGVSYTYYGKLNEYYNEYNKLSYSLPNWTKTVNVDSSDWTYIYPPNYSGILTDMYSISNDTNVTFVFSYFSMLAEYTG